MSVTTVTGGAVDVLLTGLTLVGNSISSASGGGLAVTLSLDNQHGQCVPLTPTYFPYDYNVTVVIANSTFANNSAKCPWCSGGGVSVGVGGSITMVNCTVVVCVALLPLPRPWTRSRLTKFGSCLNC